MRNSIPHDEIKDRAALYALGALSQHEARSFEEHLAEGCEDCQSELDGFEFVVSNIGFGAEGESPSPGLRDRLLSRLSEDQQNGRGKTGPQATSAQPVISIHAEEGEWREMCEGVQMKRLYLDKTTGLATSIVKMVAGSRLPVHRHNAVEQFFIIEGDCHVQGEVLGPGDFHRAEAGTVHETTYTEGGTTFLLIAPRYYEVLSER